MIKCFDFDISLFVKEVHILSLCVLCNKCACCIHFYKNYKNKSNTLDSEKTCILQRWKAHAHAHVQTPQGNKYVQPGVISTTAATGNLYNGLLPTPTNTTNKYVC